MRVIFLGPFGTYSHEAVQYFVGQAACQLIPQDTIHDVVACASEQWRMGHPTIAVVPVSNSFLGIVEETLTCLASSTLFGQAGQVVVGEVPLSIQHSLLVKPDASGKSPPLTSIKEVHSHPQALGQCAEYLERNMPQAQLIPSKSTGAAIPHVLQSPDCDVAAIASVVSAELYGLNVCARSIQTMEDNVTRFYVITKDPKYTDVAMFLNECRAASKLASNVYRSLIRIRFPKSKEIDIKILVEQLRLSTNSLWTVADVHTTTTTTDDSILFEVDYRREPNVDFSPPPSEVPASLIQFMHSWPTPSSIDCLGVWAVPASAC